MKLIIFFLTFTSIVFQNPFIKTCSLKNDTLLTIYIYITARFMILNGDDLKVMLNVANLNIHKEL